MRFFCIFSGFPEDSLSVPIAECCALPVLLPWLQGLPLGRGLGERDVISEVNNDPEAFWTTIAGFFFLKNTPPKPPKPSRGGASGVECYKIAASVTTDQSKVPARLRLLKGSLCEMPWGDGNGINKPPLCTRGHLMGCRLSAAACFHRP